MKRGDPCRRFFIVLGAPRELLTVGEIPAVSRVSGGGDGAEEARSGRGLRLLAGQYFGEKGVIRRSEVGLKYVKVWGSRTLNVGNHDWARETGERTRVVGCRYRYVSGPSFDGSSKSLC